MEDRQEKNYLTVKDVMRLADVSQITVYRWIHDGKLEAEKAVKGSRKWLINPKSLPTFIREGNYGGVVNND